MAGRANYFYCVRITNPGVLKSLQEALDWVLDKDPQYTDFCYTQQMMHVTLAEVCLPDHVAVEKASDALYKAQNMLVSNRPTSQMRIKGITTFFEKVMVAKVEYEDDFKKYQEMLSRHLKDCGVNVVEKHDFTPHVTIMKVSTMRARKAKVDNINPWLYVNLKETEFGSQDVNSIHLCKMGYDRRSDGFYQTPAEINLVS